VSPSTHVKFAPRGLTFSVYKNEISSSCKMHLGRAQEARAFSASLIEDPDIKAVNEENIKNLTKSEQKSEVNFLKLEAYWKQRPSEQRALCIYSISSDNFEKSEPDSM
jgi:hypothetical protein